MDNDYHICTLIRNAINWTNQLQAKGSFRRSWYSLTLSRNVLPFMELECSLPCSHEPATASYPETNESSPQLRTPRDSFIVILPRTPKTSKWYHPFRFSE